MFFWFYPRDLGSSIIPLYIFCSYLSLVCTGQPVRLDDVDPNITYSSGWIPEGDSDDYLATTTQSNVLGSTMTIPFAGTKISIFGSILPLAYGDAPYALFSLDNDPGFPSVQSQPMFSNNASSDSERAQHQKRFFASPDLPAGPVGLRAICANIFNRHHGKSSADLRAQPIEKEQKGHSSTSLLSTLMTSSSNSPAVVDPLLDLLCRPWHADSYDGHVILLKPDGNGEITSQAELNLFLAAHITWRIIKSGRIQESSAPTPSSLTRFQTPPATRILDVTIEVTITKQSGPMSLIAITGEHAKNMVGGHLLLDGAFEPKVFNITIERGEFVPPFDRNKPRRPFPLFGLRLTFDKSPYPAKDCWQPERAGMLEDMRQFEKTAFISEKLDYDSGRSTCISM